MKRDVYEFCAGLRGDVAISMLVPKDEREAYASLGVAVRAWSPRGWIGMYREPRVLNRIAASFDPDVVHAHDIVAATLAVATLPERYLARCALSFHDDVRPNELPEKYIRERLGPMVRSAGARTAVAPSLAASLGDHLGVAAASFAIVPHGVRTAALPDFARPRGREGPIIGWYGRLGSDRAWQVAVNVAERVHAQLPDARLVMGGDGPSKSFVKSFGKQTLGDAFELLEEATSAREIFAHVDLLLVPPSYDSQPHALLEALVCGVPVVGVNRGPIADAIAPFETGWLTTPDAAGLEQGVLDAWAQIDDAWAGAAAQRTLARERYGRETVDAEMLQVLTGLATPVGAA